MLMVPVSLLQEKIRISIIGYKSQDFFVKDLRSKNIIYLNQLPVSLAAVTISAKKNVKVKMLGNVTQSLNSIAGFVSNDLGSELAIKIKIKHKDTKLRKFAFNIVTNPFDSVKFRFNIYKPDANGDPGENLLKERIYIEPKNKTGLVELDLNKYNIYTDTDVFIAIEWIKDYGNAKGLNFSSKLFNGGTYYRKVSFDKWKKIGIVGLGLYTEVEY